MKAEVTQIEAQKMTLKVLALLVAVFFIVPLLTMPNVPLDVIESYIWGREFQWGYYKHPPLSAWLVAVFYQLRPGALWPMILLSQLCIAAGLYFTYLTAKEFLSKEKAAIATLMLCGCYYYSFTTSEFNPNVLQLTLWPALTWAFLRARRVETLLSWMLTGALAALALLSKYYSAMLLAAMALVMVRTKTGRQQLTESGVYAGLAVMVVMLFPHIRWLIKNDMITFYYALDRASGDAGVITAHLWYPLKFTLSQGLAVLGVLIMGWLLAGRSLCSFRPAAVEGERRRSLNILTFTPFVLTVLVALIGGAKLKSMWGTPLWGMLGIWLVAHVETAGLTAAQLRRMRFAAVALVALSAVVFAGRNILEPYVMGSPARMHFPGKAVAKAMASEWHKAFPDKPLKVIAGPQWVAGNTAFYMTAEQPSVYEGMYKTYSPWLSDAHLNVYGGIIVWDEDANKNYPNKVGFLRRFQGVTAHPMKEFPYQTAADIPPLKLGWAIVPPHKKKQRKNKRKVDIPEL